MLALTFVSVRPAADVALCIRFNAEKRFAKAFWSFLTCAAFRVAFKVEASSIPTICRLTLNGCH
jgi:hypothetical protein